MLTVGSSNKMTLKLTIESSTYTVSHIRELEPYKQNKLVLITLKTLPEKEIYSLTFIYMCIKVQNFHLILII